jgi:hypothetical protein
MQLSGTVIRQLPGDEGFRLTSTPILQYSCTPVRLSFVTPVLLQLLAYLISVNE